MGNVGCLSRLLASFRQLPHGPSALGGCPAGAVPAYCQEPPHPTPGSPLGWLLPHSLQEQRCSLQTSLPVVVLDCLKICVGHLGCLPPTSRTEGAPVFFHVSKPKLWSPCTCKVLDEPLVSEQKSQSPSQPGAPEGPSERLDFQGVGGAGGQSGMLRLPPAPQHSSSLPLQLLPPVSSSSAGFQVAGLGPAWAFVSASSWMSDLRHVSLFLWVCYWRQQWL